MFNLRFSAHQSSALEEENLHLIDISHGVHSYDLLLVLQAL